MNSPTTSQTLLGLTVAAVVAAVTSGLVLAGSPSTQRSRRLDGGRTGDLQTIANRMDAYRSEHARLPQNLRELFDDQGADFSIVDPTTTREYEYRSGTDNGYELCAVFEQTSNERPASWNQQGVWNHGVGRHCFQRKAKIDRR